MDRLIAAEIKIRLCIMSCRTISQLEGAERMVNLYNKINHKPGFFSSRYADLIHRLDQDFTHKSLDNLCQARAVVLIARDIHNYKYC